MKNSNKSCYYPPSCNLPPQARGVTGKNLEDADFSFRTRKKENAKSCVSLILGICRSLHIKFIMCVMQLTTWNIFKNFLKYNLIFVNKTNILEILKLLKVWDNLI